MERGNGNFKEPSVQVVGEIEEGDLFSTGHGIDIDKNQLYGGL